MLNYMITKPLYNSRRVLSAIERGNEYDRAKIFIKEIQTMEECEGLSNNCRMLYVYQKSPAQ